MRTLFTLATLLAALAAAAGPGLAADPLVVLAASSAGRIEAFDATTMYHIGTLTVGKKVESVSASPDGRRLYVAQEDPSTPDSCCSLFTLDLATREMCLLTSPALFGSPSPDGGLLFTQGKSGVDVFDARRLTRVTTMKSPGAYNLQTSPDGRWLLGITNSPKPSLDIFSVPAGAMAHQLPIPDGPATGAWAGDRYYVFTYGAGGPVLWQVRLQDAELSNLGAVRLPELYSGCNEPVLLMLTGAPDRLFLAEVFGFSVDRRHACPDAALGGIYEFRPSAGDARRIAGSLHVNRMLASPDGRDLYVLESSGDRVKGADRLVRIDTGSGSVVQTAQLQAGRWTLALAHMPVGLIPQGKERAVIYCSR